MKEKVYSIREIEFVFFELFLLIGVLEGPFRYLFLLAGMSFLIYIKDLLLLSIIFFYLLLEKCRKGHIWMLLFLAVFAFYGVINLNSFVQPAFAFVKNYSPFLSGLILGRNTGDEKYTRFVKFSNKLFWISVIGMLANMAIVYPWAGMEYSAGGFSLQVSRGLYTHGSARIEGFMKSPFNASTTIMALGFLADDRKEKRLKRICRHGTIFFCAVLSTAKSAILALCIVYLMMFFHTYIRQFSKRMLKKACWAAGFVMVCLPVFAERLNRLKELLVQFGTGGDRMYLVASFIDRMSTVYPSALDTIKNEGGFLFGRGLGGMGSAQHLSEPFRYNPCDNSFLFLLAAFGACAVVIMVFLIIKINTLAVSGTKKHACCYWNLYWIMVFILYYGIVGTVEELPILMAVAGIAVEAAYQNRRGGMQI